MRWLWISSAVLLAAVACRPSPPAPATPPRAEPALPTQAQPPLRAIRLWVGPQQFTAELALTTDQIQTGMMFRTNIAENEGMLFVFRAPHRASFWMKNVHLPLSCAYIDPDGIIREIHPMEPHNEAPIVAGTDRIQFVLETAGGWFERHGIGPGVLVRTEAGSLAETLVGRGPAR